MLLICPTVVVVNNLFLVVDRQIQDAIIAKGTVILSIDNAKLAQDDFRVKYEKQTSVQTYTQIWGLFLETSLFALLHPLQV